MTRPFLIWDQDHEFGDVVIAEFERESDAILFAKAKAKREGGFVSTLLVGTDWHNRTAIPVD